MNRAFLNTARLAAVLALAAALLPASGLVSWAVAAPTPAPKTTVECQKVKDCVHVAGPWVIVPATGIATWLVECPKRSGVVAGTDVRATSIDIRVWWEALSGGPASGKIGQGVAHSFLLWHGVSATGKIGAFRPLLGCIPLKKVNPSPSTLSARAALPGKPVGVPLEPRATVVEVVPGKSQSETRACVKRERLVGAWDGLAFAEEEPPNLANAALVTKKYAILDSKVAESIQSADTLSLSVGAEVQVGALCAP